MRIREARWQDLAALAELEARAFPDDAWSETTFWAELAQRPRREYVVAVAPGGPDGSDPDRERVLGYAGLDLAGDVADVMTIAVDPAHRGSGTGSALLEELHTRAVRTGADRMLLEVRADNEPARGLYDRRGYTELSRRRGYYRGVDGAPAVDALVLTKELTHP